MTGWDGQSLGGLAQTRKQGAVLGFWQGKTVLVTGATGFLGGWICRQLLEQGAGLVSLQRRERPKSQFTLAGFAQSAMVVEGSLLDADFLSDLFEARRFDAVFHLASMVDVNAALRDPPAALKASIDTTIARCWNRCGKSSPRRW